MPQKQTAREGCSEKQRQQTKNTEGKNGETDCSGISDLNIVGEERWRNEEQDKRSQGGTIRKLRERRLGRETKTARERILLRGSRGERSSGLYFWERSTSALLPSEEALLL